MTDGQRDTLHRERKEYQEKQGNNNYGGNKSSIEKMLREKRRLEIIHEICPWCDTIRNAISYNPTYSWRYYYGWTKRTGKNKMTTRGSIRCKY